MPVLNKKTLHAKNALKNALLNLMDSQRISEITVAELCRSAGINRTTFYKYYTIPEDIMEEISRQTYEDMTRILEEEKQLGQNYDAQSLLVRMCRYYYDNRNMAKWIFQSKNDLPSLMVKMDPSYSKFDGRYASREQSFRIRFISGGFTAVIGKWYLEEFKESPEEIAAILSNLTKNM